MTFQDTGVDDWVTPDLPSAAPAAAEGDDWITPEAIEFGSGKLDPYVKEIGQRFALGATEQAASALRGAAAGSEENRRLQSAIEGIQQGEDIDVAVQRPAAPATPITEEPLYQAGEAVSRAAKSVIGEPAGKLHPLVGDVASGLGSVAGNILTLGTTAVPAGMGEAVEKAVKEGATPEQQHAAGRAGGIAGATDYADLLLTSLGSTGKALGLIKRVGMRALEGAITEGGQEGLQQFIQNAIAQGTYKPDQDLFEDVPYNMLVGAIVGGGVSSVAGGREAATEGRGGVRAQPRQVQQIDDWIVPEGAVPAETLLPTEQPDDRQIQPGLPSEVGGGPQPVQAQPVQGAGTEAAPAGGILQAPQPAAPANPPGQDVTGQEVLQRLLEDPRSADEIRADMERVRAAQEAAAAFQPSADWQDVPQFYEPPAEGVDIKVNKDGRLQVRLAPAAGTREAPVQVAAPEDVHAGAEVTAAPTPAQAEAGNYQKRHLRWQGFDIAIETEAGQERTGTAPDGTPWSVRMPAPYGYIKRTTGKDGDHLDVYLGPQPASDRVFVVDQYDPQTGKFDEHKALIGFPDEQAALAAYDAAFSDGSGPARRRTVGNVSVAEFKEWLANGNQKRPFVQQKAVGVQPRGPTGPLTFKQWLAWRGGLKPDPGGDLKSLGLTSKTRIMIPGVGWRNLIRRDGMDLDRAREAAVEAGFLQDVGHISGAQYTTTPNDVLRLLAEPEEQYAPGELAGEDEKARRRQEADEYRLEGAIAEVQDFVKEHGLLATDAQIREAAELSLTKGVDPTDAIDHIIERDSLAVIDEAEQYQEPERDNAAQAVTAGAGPSVQEGAATVEQPAHAPAAENEPAPSGVQPGQDQQGGSRPEAVEPGADNKPQLVIPGTEPDLAGAAQNAANKPLKPKAPQKPADEGLFGEQGQQDLVEQAQKRFEYDKHLTKEGERKANRATVDALNGEISQDEALAQVAALLRAGAISEGYARVTLNRLDLPEGKVRAAFESAAPAEQPEKSKAETQQVRLARAIYASLKAGNPITARALQAMAEEAYGSKLSEGKFDRKAMYDAMELAANMVVASSKEFRADTFAWEKAAKNLEGLVQRLPTQTVRSEEQEAFQQFSTPPHYAMAVAFAANLRNGDTVLEPSAGTGSIVAAASRPGAKIIANELAPARAALLRELIGEDGQVFTENAEQIGNILPNKGVKPTVVVMNPPFSQTAGRLAGKKDIMVGANHITQALLTLQPGGRLVAIVGRGMTMGAPRFREWWQKVSEKYAVRANIGVEGSVYAKYGTQFGTRLLVIDKVPPTGDKPVLTDVQTVEDLMRALEPIRDARPAHAAQQQPSQPRSPEVAEGSEGQQPEPALPPRPEPDGVGTGEGSAGGVAAPRPSGTRAPSGRPAGAEAGGRPGVPGQPGGGRPGAAEEGSATRPAAGGNVAGGGVIPPGHSALPDATKPASTAAGSERVELENAKPGSQGKATELSDNLYEPYEPSRVRVKGAKKHPGPLVESAAMSAVEAPEVKYRASIPKSVIEKGQLSLPQLEAVTYAGQAHEQMLPAAENETKRRKGFFIGDGTGVGKGREIAGIILDNWQQGRKKAVWVSEKRKLMNDAQRDWSGLGQDKSLIFNVGKTKTGEPIKGEKGIAFITYDTLKGGLSAQEAVTRGGFAKGEQVRITDDGSDVQLYRGKIATVTGKAITKNRANFIPITFEDGTKIEVLAGHLERVGEAKQVDTRIDQIVEWVGEDFDGVIAFDEAHNMANATATVDAGRKKEAAQKALAGLQLQERLPNARVVYVSATGATEVSNLAYADRLGLWGRGTAFASRADFVSKVEQGGVAAMEIVAQDMKRIGAYMARNLSYDDGTPKGRVEYTRLEHKLTDSQREIYDTSAEAWQVVLQNFEKALEDTNGAKDWRARAAAKSAFWGAHQRFFNQIITSMQMPSVLKAARKDLEEGRQVVLQLTNTNEASQERAAAKATTEEELEDLDITPRDQLIQLIEKSFPTQQYEEYVDPNNPDKVQVRPVFDADGNPVENAEAVAMRDALIERVASLKVPQGPLDLILDHFGTDVVAEVTGRKRRFVLKPDEKTGEKKRTEESRPASANQAETDNFQAGKKKVLVFSEAGGTGASYHADNTAPSKDARRVHYLVQAGWRADKAVQGFGRTHRTNQDSAPIFVLVTTDLDGQKRFISSIARRLAQLGALTKGQRQAGDQGVFSARDNLESREAERALARLWRAMQAGRGAEAREFERQTGLFLLSTDNEGRIRNKAPDPPEITQFLNRLLSLKIDTQNRVFREFSEHLDAVIEMAQQMGTLDLGLETVKADKISKAEQRVVHTDENSGAKTDYVKLTLANRFKPKKMETVEGNLLSPVKKWVKSPHGKVYAAEAASNETNAEGDVIERYRLVGPVSSSRLIKQESVDGRGSKWETITRDQAHKLWLEETAAAPEFIERDLHLITGAILPIWDRLKGHPRVVRLQTDEGERFLGRIVPEDGIDATLAALGAEGTGQGRDPQKVFDHVMQGGRAKLANGWTLKRSLVAGEQRIELTGPSSFSEGQQVKNDGVFTERIAYEVRYFIPTGENGPQVIERITKDRPVVEMTGRGGVVEEVDRVTPRLRIPAAQRSAVLRAVIRVMEHISGHGVSVRDAAEIADLPTGKGWGSLGEGDVVRQGAYAPVDRVIYLSFDAVDFVGTALHEAYHDVEAWLQTDREREVMLRETDRLREYVLENSPKDYTREEIEGIAGYEVRAEAFRVYVQQRLKGEAPKPGLNAVVARFFGRLMRLLREVRNALAGHGFQTAEDIFERYQRGEAAGRKPKMQTDFTLKDMLEDVDRNASVPPINPATATAQQRQRSMLGFITRGQPLDRAMRVPFDLFGGTNRKGEWEPGIGLHDKAAKIITNAKFSPQGRFTWLNPMLETVRGGLMDRYHLRDRPEYIQRERERSLDERAVMLQGAEILDTLREHSVGPQEAKVLQAILTGEPVNDADMAKLAEPIRAAIDQLGQDAVALGLLSRESFERNRGAYLHRVYQKYESEQNGLARMVSTIMGAKRKKIIGDQFRGRGLFHEIALARLMKNVPDWHEGARGKPENGEKFIRLDEISDQAPLEFDGEAPPPKTIRTVWWPADRAIPDQYSAFKKHGVWEVRGTKNGNIVLWRDFTKAEREKMGEIVDARYTIGKTFMLMAHDLANGKLYKDIAENEEWARTHQPNEPWLDAAEWQASRMRYRAKQVEWVKVPDTAIPNSGGKRRWGALAGTWVREEIWRDLNEIDIMQRPGVWRSLMSQWKLNKTARSPTVHMHNVMSNFFLMDLIDGRWQDLVRGLRSYAKGDRHYEEAFEAGAFGADMISQEVRDNVLKPILEELEGAVQHQTGRLGLMGFLSKYTSLLAGGVKQADKWMRDAYRIEDEIFRMAIYMRQRELGDDPKQAAQTAREQFVDYDIRAPWVNAARNTVLPFISYTYRVVPLIARAIATRPWKLGKYFLLAYAANALAYAMLGDEGDEEKERKALDEKEQGRTWLGAYRMTRMPFNDKYGNPLFLDIRRWVPAGDVFDLSGGDLPSWMQISGPLMLGAELALNRSAFTGKEIFNTKIDDWWERQWKRGDYAYKALMPSAAYIPGSWYWEKIENARKGATDRQGRPYGVGAATAGSVGVHIKPLDIQDAMERKGMDIETTERELRAEARRLSRGHARKFTTDTEYEKQMQRILEKSEKLGKKAQETFE